MRKRAKIHVENVDDVKIHAIPAEEYIFDLENNIDGLVICSNALDHTPEWAFVLSNISLYMKTGAYLLMNTFLNYPMANPAGHYNITHNPNQFYRLLESMGFEIVFEHINKPDDKQPRWYTLYTNLVARKK